MRITMRTIHQNILGNLNTLTRDMNRINSQISSGKQMSKISDNPVNLITALSLRSNMAEIEQYQENIMFGNNMITASESALTGIKEMAIRAKTLALQQVNASISPENRKLTAGEVGHLWEQAIFLGNTEVNGKFVFGGYRTTGYTDTEPAPFVADQIDGYRVNAQNIDTTDQWLTSTVDTVAPADLIAGDVLINGVDIGAVILTNPLTDGLNMDGAANIATAVNGAAIVPAVTANLTTLTYSAAATTAAIADADITITLNGTAITIPVLNGDNAATVNAKFVNEVNAQSGLTGVTADIGDGTNGAAADILILKNIMPGDNSVIDITAFADGGTGTSINFAIAAQAADATHNTGQISLSSTESFEITSNNVADDSILNQLGLDGGDLGFADVTADGQLNYGSNLAAGDIEINGIPVGATVDDGVSTIYTDTSAAAKATAINALTTTTGVSADITPVYLTAAGAVIPGTLASGDLIINGEDIFDNSAPTNADPSTIIYKDTDNILLNAINAKSGVTGIVASRGNNGVITLAANDGRNLHIQTSANGENITQLNGAAVNTPASKVYYGSIQLTSDLQFTLETTPTGSAPNIYEPGLDAIGLGGGAAITGEANDIVDDGKLTVATILEQDGNVRYTGDRYNDVAIKVGQQSTLKITKNGQDAIAETGVFTVLKTFEEALLGQKYTSVTGINQATDITATLDSENTGLDQEYKSFSDGDITFTVKDHSYYPPQDLIMDIGVDISTDTPESIAAKINGIPGMTASWTPEGYLKMETSDPDRYTFNFSDTTFFLDHAGIDGEQLQVQALEKTIADLDILMESLTSQASDFGARANRIDIQNEIYVNIKIATKENLSEKEDTDMIKALMEMKAKEMAYEAALSAAAKTMQMSLVDYMK